MLRAAGHLRVDADPVELGQQLAARLGDELLAVGPALVDHLLDLGVLARVERHEREVLELPLDRVDAEPVRDRRVDLERLLGLLDLLLLAQVGQRPHVVQAVGELDHDDADVLRHRQDHLAVVLGLRLLAGGELDARQLRDAVDQQAHVLAEPQRDLVGGRLGVLDHVVQQRRRQHRRRLLQPRADLGDAPRVQDVLLAALAQLPVVVLAGERERVGHERRLRVGHVREQVIDELLQELAMAFGGVGERCGHAYPHGTRPHQRRTLRP